MLFNVVTIGIMHEGAVVVIMIFCKNVDLRVCQHLAECRERGESRGSRFVLQGAGLKLPYSTHPFRRNTTEHYRTQRVIRLVVLLDIAYCVK